MHGGAHEAVDEDRAGLLVHLVLHGVGVHRDLDDHVERVGDMLAGGDLVERHGFFLMRVNESGLTLILLSWPLHSPPLRESVTFSPV